MKIKQKINNPSPLIPLPRRGRDAWVLYINVWYKIYPLPERKRNCLWAECEKLQFRERVLFYTHTPLPNPPPLGRERCTIILHTRHTERSEISHQSRRFFNKKRPLSLETLAEPTKRSWVEWNCVPYGWLILFSSSPWGEDWGEGLIWTSIILDSSGKFGIFYSTFFCFSPRMTNLLGYFPLLRERNNVQNLNNFYLE